MNYLISAKTDIGIKKNTNQDSLTVKILNTPKGRMVFAVLCDGMGGLDKGEVASATVIKAFSQWLEHDFSHLCSGIIQDQMIKQAWENIIEIQSQKIMDYGNKVGIRLGTTATVLLLTNDRFYIMNVGDTRAYVIDNVLKQITEDQTFVSREVKLGNMTEMEAAQDSRKNVLLQCIGASQQVFPEMFFGETKQNAVYMLCTDGFRHEITENEIYEKLNPSILLDVETMDRNAEHLIELNKQRNEKDNISVVIIRTY